jgi:putative tryptophan/tyrosine transport system substrate-binding protein
MRRREFITLLGGAAAAWPVAARAQQALPTIGFLSSTAAHTSQGLRVVPFLKGLKDEGFIESQSVHIAFAWADNDYDRLPRLAVDLINRQVAVIAADSPAAVAAKVATQTIPIVFNSGTDPIQLGLVASLNRPDGNLTGVTTLNAEVGPKRLELLHDLLPAATAVAVLVNPTSPSASIISRDIETAARTIGLKLDILHASADRDLDAVFGTLSRLRAAGLVIAPDPFFNTVSERLATLALHAGIPAVYQYREFVTAGGVMSYGGSLADSYRLVGAYTGRILKGEKPADLPVQQSTTVELIINLKAAATLGLTVPLPLLARADEVIE